MRNLQQFKTLGRVLLKRENKNEPITDPLITPDLTDLVEDTEELIDTL